MARLRSSLTNCLGRFTTFPGDQFEESKRYIYWHTWLGSGYADAEDFHERQEKAKQELRDYWETAHPMVKYLAKLQKAILVAYREEADRTKYPAKRSAEFWRLDDAIRSVNKRLDYWLSK